jgi:D-arabinose 1-dehydrogenase-like Zn-dependent alcohol dehydrogenase
MKALVLEEPGDPPRLVVQEVPTPAPGAREVLVRVAACGVCYHDVLVMWGVLRRGVKPRPILGHEIAGEVVECGALVTSVSPGDRVASILTDACGVCAFCQQGREHRCQTGAGIGHGADGGFAEYVKVRESSLVKLPQDADPVGSCLYGCPMGVALHALRDAGGLRAGETAVVTGAGGGLGVHAVQLARALGARVLAVTTSPEKELGLRDLGAHEVLVAPELDFGEIVLAMTEDRGAEVVMNTVGALAFDASWTALGQFGRMLVVGDVTGGQVALRPAEFLFKDARLIGVSGVSRQQLGDVARMAAARLVRPVVSRTFPLEEAREAYRLMQERRSFGRLALVPG